MNASAAFDKLNRCLQDVKEWMSASKLKPNPDKTEFILFGSKKQRERLNVCFPIDILGNHLHPTKSVRNLGVWFDSDFSFSKHVQNVCKSCFIHLRDFRNIRQFLTHDAAVSVYCLFGVLRRFQHCTGHITMGSWKGRGNQYIEFARVLYCKLPTNGKQLPAFPLEAMTGIEPRPQRWRRECFVSSRLDYCNSLFRSLSKFNLHRLQSIQNSAARIVTNLSKYTRITPVLRKLHWLPVQFRSNWLPWCTSLFILASLNILLHIYPHTIILTILDIVRVLPISLMYQNFNLKSTSPLSS